MSWTDEESAAYRNGLLAGQTAARLGLGERASRAFEVAESNLIDDYVAGALKPDERAAFEQFYLITPGRRQSVDLARAIARLAHRQRLRRWLIGIAAALVIAAIFWAGWSRPEEATVLALAAGNDRSASAFPTVRLSEIKQTLSLEMRIPEGAPPCAATLTRIGEATPHLQVNVAGGDLIRIPVARAGLREGEYIVSLRSATDFRREFRFRAE